jgi:hypothetical protein
MKWKERVVAYFKVQSLYLLRETEEIRIVAFPPAEI